MLKTTKLVDAVELVLELARPNLLSSEAAATPALKAERERQLEAVALVAEFAKKWL